MSAPVVLDEEGLRRARAYLNSEGNRANHRRSADRESHAAQQGFADGGALAWLVSQSNRDAVAAELAPLAETFNRHLRRPVRAILDAGSGMGISAVALAGLYPGAEVLGVDIEEPAVALAQHLYRDEPRCSFQCATLEDFAFDASFDLIYCREVLEHVFDPARVVANLVGRLAPGGVMYMETPNYRWPWEPHLRLPMLPKSPKWLLRQQARLTGRDAGFVDHLHFECDPPTLRRWAREAQPTIEVVDLMADKVHAVFSGTDSPRVGSRARVVDALRRQPRAARRLEKALLRLELTPSVMLIVVKQ